MKAWILKNDLSHSPQAALKMYASSGRRSRYSSDISIVDRSRQHFLVRRLKAQLKGLSKMLTQEAVADLERS